MNRGGDIRYSLDGSYYTQGRFDINENDGNVYVNEALDRDYPGGTANWQFSVVAEDEIGLPGGAPKPGYGIVNYRLIDINDNAPFFDTSTIEDLYRKILPAGRW